MKRRTFLIGSASTAGVLVFSACNDDDDPADTSATQDQEAERRPVLRLPGGDQGFPSPFAYQRGGGYVQMSLLYDTLLWKDSTGEFIPWLAKSFEQADGGLTYSFQLEEDARWQDGRPVTADDVVFTFQYYRDKEISPQVIVQPPPSINEVVATAERTVEFRLANPDAIFLEAAANGVPIVPAHVWSEIEDPGMATDLAVLVGSGPYRLESYDQGAGSYLYVANDDYFLGSPFVERIENLPVGDELTALQSGEVDAAGGSDVRPEALAPFRNDDAFGVIEAPPGSAQLALHWNLARGGALADVAFRRACAYAIDREDLVQRLFGGNGTPGNPGWMPPDNPFQVEVEQYPFDPQEANRLLDEAGYARDSDGGVRQGPDDTLRFELLSTTPAPPVLDVLVEALGAIGVELVPQTLDTPSFNQRVIAGQSEMSLISAGGVNSDPFYMYEVYDSSTKRTQHAQGYENPRFDELARQQLMTLDQEERMVLVAEMQEIVATDLPLLPLYYADSFHIFRKEVFDPWYFTPGGVAVRVPTAYNRQVFVTGRDEGTKIRSFDE